MSEQADAPNPAIASRLNSELLQAGDGMVSSQEIAEREVERLTCEKGCRYFWQTPRFVELPEEMGSERV